VRVVVEFQRSKTATPEGDGMNFPVISEDGEYGRDGVVRSVRLDSNLTVRNPVVKDRSFRKRMLESFECQLALVRPVPLHIRTSEASEGNGDVRIRKNETPIEVAKTKEGLDVLNLPRNWPAGDSGNLVRSHPETIGRQNVAEVFTGGDAEFAFWKLAIQPSSPEATKYLPDMSSVIGRIIGVDQDVVQIDDNVNVQQICEQGVKEALEGGRCVRKAFRHNAEVVGTVA